jgi:hypothetical protein
MALLLKNSCFIHVNRTAGSWMRAALKNAGLAVKEIGIRHASVARVNQLHPGLFTFGFVRNPAEWLKSTWAYGQSKIEGGRIPMPKLWHKVVPWRPEFQDFVDAYLEHAPGHISRLFNERLEGARYVGMYERRISHLLEALQWAGEEFDPEKLVAEPRKVRGRTAEWGMRAIFRRGQRKAILEVEPVAGKWEYR